MLPLFPKKPENPNILNLKMSTTNLFLKFNDGQANHLSRPSLAHDLHQPESSGFEGRLNLHFRSPVSSRPTSLWAEQLARLGGLSLLGSPAAASRAPRDAPQRLNTCRRRALLCCPFFKLRRSELCHGPLRKRPCHLGIAQPTEASIQSGCLVGAGLGPQCWTQSWGVIGPLLG